MTAGTAFTGSSKNGILFIPDISGYSRFVKETDAEEGATIVAALLDALIGANRLPLKSPRSKETPSCSIATASPIPSTLFSNNLNTWSVRSTRSKKN